MVLKDIQFEDLRAWNEHARARSDAALPSPAWQVLGNHLRHFSKELQQGAFHEDDITNIKRLGKRPDCIQLMSKSLAPSIFGHEFEKTALLLMLLGGCERNLANGATPPRHCDNLPRPDRAAACRS